MLRVGVLFLAFLCLSGCAQGLQNVRPADTSAVELRLSTLEKKVDQMSQEMALMKNAQTLDVLVMELIRTPFFWILAFILVVGLVAMIDAVRSTIMPFFKNLHHRHAQEGKKK